MWWWRLREKSVKALPGSPGRVNDAAIGEAFDVGATDFGELAGAGNGVIVEEAPLVTQLGEGGKLGVI